ncbi:MAG TPA: enoyl-CoA hydratase-related protein [Gammaproteobacteria bacterium]|nr:enoyl-CoA hydratase-related protein [Gammaproteobacteria bacterium]
MSEILVNKTENGVAEIVLNRPDVHNAMDEKLVQAFTDALVRLECDDEVHIICLKGAGKHFCAGADLNWMTRMMDATREENVQDAKNLAFLLEKLHHSKKPTVAIVHGAAYGGGAGLVAACDIAIATPDAKFCFPEVKLGLVPAIISPYVISAIGERQAKRYFLTGEVIEAKRAHEIGLIHEVDGKGESIIPALLENSSNAMKIVQKLFLGNEKLPELLAEIRTTDDVKNRLGEFLKKKSKGHKK